jgi:hypothetical protein
VLTADCLAERVRLGLYSASVRTTHPVRSIQRKLLHFVELPPGGRAGRRYKSEVSNGTARPSWDTGGKKPNDCMERLGVPLFAT